MQWDLLDHYVLEIRTPPFYNSYNVVHHTFLPLKIKGGGFWFLKLGQRVGSWKNCSEIGGLIERGGGPNCFTSFSSEKHVVITIGIILFSFLVWYMFPIAVINRSILSCGLHSTRKWYIMKFLFLLPLLLHKILWNFYY